MNNHVYSNDNKGFIPPYKTHVADLGWQCLIAPYTINRPAQASSVWSYEGKYIKTILLGDDGRFWVMDTNREAGLLIKAGYERD